MHGGVALPTLRKPARCTVFNASVSPLAVGTASRGQIGDRFVTRRVRRCHRTIHQRLRNEDGVPILERLRRRKSPLPPGEGRVRAGRRENPMLLRSNSVRPHP